LNEGWSYSVLRDSGTNALVSAFGLTSFLFAAAIDGKGNIAAPMSGQIPANQFGVLVASAAGTMPG
jgi:hypothetical protein